MKTYPAALSAILLISTLASCANEKPLTGGEKDTMPPQLLASEPANETVNFQNDEITLHFDEYVKVEQLASQLIITPKLEEVPEYRIKKYSVTLELRSPLADSTTYVFNFRESIKDITEGNSVENLVLSISTGSFIDSLYLTGTVVDKYNNVPLEEATVGLYPVNDTIDLFNEQPTYFTKTDPEGNFLLRNLKAGNYRIWAWKDENSNLRAESRNEPYAFWKDIITLNGDSIPPIEFSTQQLNTQEFKINNHRPVGQYFQITFNKSVQEYKVEVVEDKTATISHNLADEKRTLRFYNSIAADSLQISIWARDTIDQIIEDTLYIKFKPSQRPSATFTNTITPPAGTSILPETNFRWEFSKPVPTANLDSLRWTLDSLNSYPLQVLSYEWNSNRTILSVRTNFPDSLLIRSIDKADTTRQTLQENFEPLNSTLELVAPLGTFYSIEMDTLPHRAYTYRKINPTARSIIKGKIISPYALHFVQLLQNGEVKYETTTSNSYEFLHIEPGDYQLRVLVDENGDGKWKPGNILTQEQGEQVYHYEGDITLRANWERTDVNITL